MWVRGIFSYKRESSDDDDDYYEGKVLRHEKWFVGDLDVIVSISL